MMMNKLYKIIVLIALFPVFMCGCSGLLDDVKPDTSIPVPNLTNSDLPLVAKGMYKRLSGGFYYMSCIAEDIASDNLTTIYEVANNINFRQFDNCNVGINDGLICARMNSFPYNGIGLANILINFVKEEDPQDVTVRTAKGEALLMRGYCYMLLAERFGKAIITLSTDEDMYREQAPENKVWEQAINDLQSAIKLLPEFTTPNSASIQAAKAVLARLYLNYGVLSNNTKMIEDAGKLASEVINNGGKLALNPNFKENFISTGTGNEVIWRLVETATTPTDFGLYWMLSPKGYVDSPRGDTWMEETLYKLYESKDKRLSVVDVQPYEPMGHDYPYCVKYPADEHPVWPFVRLAEMYLITSEVAARQGTVDVTGYNAVRAIRGVSQKQNTDFTDAADFLKEIENERRREFVAEGLRWFDMRRFGSITSLLEAKGVDTRRVHFPIWSSELSKNPKLKQTEYYN